MFKGTEVDGDKLYVIWLRKNYYMFKGTEVDEDKLFSLVQTRSHQWKAARSYQWIAVRSRQSAFSFSEWLMIPKECDRLLQKNNKKEVGRIVNLVLGEGNQ
ncbi:hypothetical protein SLEP1_g50923 [Rubroshorea leprosula]|uniref:Uncharacterized protein n=1 Tax=Rubroshorea leprosula TaxID=152421 RepID=A0AAV5M3P7_9ROSI|nr:hypothetical protein SLEP1_g50923 [Rubroshorea leprosula]